MTDIDKWIEKLAGRDDEQDDVNHLRQVILKQTEDLEKSEATDPDNNLRLTALLSRLHREGLLDDRPLSKRATGKIWWTFFAKSGYALVLVLGIGISIFLLQPTGMTPHTSFNIASVAPYMEMRTRGSSENTVESASEIEALVLELKKYSIPYELIQDKETWILRFFIADVQSDDASVWVESKKFNVQPNGWVVVKFKDH